MLRQKNMWRNTALSIFRPLVNIFGSLIIKYLVLCHCMYLWCVPLFKDVTSMTLSLQETALCDPWLNEVTLTRILSIRQITAILYLETMGSIPALCSWERVHILDSKTTNKKHKSAKLWHQFSSNKDVCLLQNSCKAEQHLWLQLETTGWLLCSWPWICVKESQVLIQVAKFEQAIKLENQVHRECHWPWLCTGQNTAGHS